MRARDIGDKRLVGIVTEADLVRGKYLEEGGAEATDEETERILVALADAVPGVLRTRVLTGGQR